MKNSCGVIAAFISGAVVGGILGAFLMSENGKELRNKISDFIDSSDNTEENDTNSEEEMNTTNI